MSIVDTLARPTWTLWQREVVRFYRDRSRIVGALATPILFWVLLGIAAIALPIVGMIKALDGTYYRYPVIGVAPSTV